MGCTCFGSGSGGSESPRSPRDKVHAPVACVVDVVAHLDEATGGDVEGSDQSLTRVPRLASVVQRELVDAARASDVRFTASRVAPAPGDGVVVRVTFNVESCFNNSSGTSNADTATYWVETLNDTPQRQLVEHSMERCILRDVPVVLQCTVQLRPERKEESAGGSRSGRGRVSAVPLRTSIRIGDLADASVAKGAVQASYDARQA